MPPPAAGNLLWGQKRNCTPLVDSLAPLTLAMMPRKEGSLSRTLGAVIIVSTSGSSDPCIRWGSTSRMTCSQTQQSASCRDSAYNPLAEPGNTPHQAWCIALQAQSYRH